MPLIKRKTQLVCAQETTVGTEIGLGVGDADIMAYDIEMQPNIEMIDRPEMGTQNHHESIAGLQSATCTFKTGFTGGTGGTSGAWAEILMEACGWVKTLEVFSPVLQAPGTGATDPRTLTMEVRQDGIKKLMVGAMGNFVIVAETGKPIMIEWTFTGKWAGFSTAALIASTFPAQKPIRYANAAVTINSVANCHAALRMDAGNTVVMRECQSDVTAGYLSAIITDRKSMLTFDPETVVTATEDPYLDWRNSTEQAFSWVVDDGTDSCTAAAAKVQYTNIQGGDRNGLVTNNLTLQCNDDLVFTWAA